MHKQAILFILLAATTASAAEDASPLDIRFTRQAVRRIVFDDDSAIPLSVFSPAKVVNMGIEYPHIRVSGGDTTYEIQKDQLLASAKTTSESARWLFFGE